MRQVKWNDNTRDDLNIGTNKERESLQRSLVAEVEEKEMERRLNFVPALDNEGKE